ncbi:MAG: hypothetical protein ACKVVO_06980 [Opitutaceae bacterium]
MMITLFVIHLACSCALVGLIWTIQVVHYPLLKQVGPEEFVAYHARHMALITWLVGPLMLAELGTAGWLLFLGERSWFFVVSLAALALAWICTAIFQIPLHQKLASGYDVETIDRLVRTNSWRTLCWTIRGLCLCWLLIQKFH